MRHRVRHIGVVMMSVGATASVVGMLAGRLDALLIGTAVACLGAYALDVSDRDDE